MKKIIFIILLAIVSITNVLAASTEYEGTIYQDAYFNGVYVKAVKESGWSKYFTAQRIKRSTDSSLVYCLDPYTQVEPNQKYTMISNDHEKFLNMSEETWHRVALLAYYGYGYKASNYNHRAETWWIITQMMIWQTVKPTSDIYFTSSLNGPKDPSIYSTQMAEMETLIATHTEPPIIKDIPNYIIKGNSATIELGYTTLKNYTVTSNANTTISNGTYSVTITPDQTGTVNLNLTKIQRFTTNPIIYYSPSSQLVMAAGALPEITHTFPIQVISPSVTITKVDSETGTSQGTATLEGATYGVYNSADQKLGTMTTDQNHQATFTDFQELGTYYLLEESPSTGYLLNQEKVTFTLTENNPNINLTVEEKVIKGQVQLEKTTTSTSPKLPLEGAIYGIYNESFKQVDTLTIDENNQALSIKLPYGTYYIKELTPPPGYLLDETIYEVTISKEGQIYEVTSKEEIIKGTITIFKEDKETGKTPQGSAKLEGAIYTIYNENNEIVETLTIKENLSATSKLLPYGHYKIKETTPSIGYNIDPTIYEVFIDTHQKNYQITSYEEVIKGQIKINKIPAAPTASSVANAIYGIYNSENTLVEELKINSENTATSKLLPYGTYTVKELQNPSGFLLDETTYEVKLTTHNEEQLITSEEPVEESSTEEDYIIPDTYKLSPSYSSLIILGLLLIIYAKKKVC